MKIWSALLCLLLEHLPSKKMSTIKHTIAHMIFFMIMQELLPSVNQVRSDSLGQEPILLLVVYTCVKLTESGGKCAI